jgi:hypothetical protein
MTNGNMKAQRWSHHRPISLSPAGELGSVMDGTEKGWLSTFSPQRTEEYNGSYDPANVEVCSGWATIWSPAVGNRSMYTPDMSKIPTWRAWCGEGSSMLPFTRWGLQFLPELTGA